MGTRTIHQVPRIGLTRSFGTELGRLRCRYTHAVTQTISLRPAQPTIDDGLTFARYLDMSADGLFRLMFGPTFESIVAKSFVEPGHDLSFEYVTFSIRGDETVGMMSAYTSDQHSGFSTKPLMRALGWRVLRVGMISLLLVRLLRFLDKFPEGGFYLQTLAADPESRGQGIGTQLFGHTQAKAADAGADPLVLHVAVDNTGARRLYERLGMHVTATSPRYSPLPRMQVNRMVKPL